MDVSLQTYILYVFVAHSFCYCDDYSMEFGVRFVILQIFGRVFGGQHAYAKSLAGLINWPII